VNCTDALIYFDSVKNFTRFDCEFFHDFYVEAIQIPNFESVPLNPLERMKVGLAFSIIALVYLSVQFTLFNSFLTFKPYPSSYLKEKSKKFFHGITIFKDLISFPYFDEPVDQFKLRIKGIADLAQQRNRKEIFVSVPSYRDALCSDTLKNMFENAKFPERIFVGLCDQVKADDVQEICKPPKEFEKQVRIARIDYSLSRGPTFARYIASKLWDGEQYFLKIDAHSHFLKDWDEIAIQMIEQFPEKTILTHYPVASDDLLGHNSIKHYPWLCKAEFRKDPFDGLIIQSCQECHPENHPDAISCPSPFIAAGFLFGSSKMLFDVPYDRHLPWLFEGEELLLAARLWTNGWNFFSPMNNLISHQYGYRSHSIRGEVQKVASDEGTMQRVRYLLGQYLPYNGEWKKTPYPSQNDEELAELGMGKVRSLDEYLRFAQIDWKVRKDIYNCFSKYDASEKKWIKIH
jgi:hypothetical protein